MSWIDGRRKSQFNSEHRGSRFAEHRGEVGARGRLALTRRRGGDHDDERCPLLGLEERVGVGARAVPVQRVRGVPRSAAAAVCWKSSDVRTARYASAARESGAETATRSCWRCCDVLSLGTSASTGSSNAVSASSRVRSRRSSLWATSARPTPARKPKQPAEHAARDRVVERRSAGRRNERVVVAGGLEVVPAALARAEQRVVLAASDRNRLRGLERGRPPGWARPRSATRGTASTRLP